MSFKIVASDSKTGARAGILKTVHSEVRTPAFMPVATKGSVKSVSPDELHQIGAQAIISKKIESNRFSIQTDKPNVEVSWQVTGIRQDAYANAHRIPIEEFKSEKERGSYLYPDVFGQPEGKSVEWVRHPAIMKEMKAQQNTATAPSDR